MPSAWNRIGVNWLDLSSTRLEPVINEIYNATLERDYWLRFTQGDTSLPPKTTLSRNTSYQIRYIYTTFERWFKPLSGLSSSQLLLSGYYIYEDGNPTSDPTQEFTTSLAFSTPYGKDSYNYLSGGNLSTLVNYDMSFLASGVPNGRANIEHLQVFHKVLNLNLKNRIFRLIKSGADYFSDSTRQNNFLQMFVTDGVTDEPETAGDTVNIINNAQNTNQARYVNFRMGGSVDFQRVNQIDELYDGSFVRRQISLDDYNIENFNLSCYYRIWDDIDSDFSINYTPSVGNYLIGNNFRDLIVSNQGGAVVTVYDPLPNITTSTISGVNPFDKAEINLVPQNFIDINNSELISYYTE